MDELPLAGRAALITGVSRRRGIGFAVASRLARMGASLAIHHHAPHDCVEYGESRQLVAIRDELQQQLRGDAVLVDVPGDLSAHDSPAVVIDAARAGVGHLDVLVCNHAHGGDAVSLRDTRPTRSTATGPSTPGRP